MSDAGTKQQPDPDFDPQDLDPELHRMEQPDPDFDPQDLDPELHQMEQEEPPQWRGDLTYQSIEPVPTDKKYRKLNHCYLQPQHGPNEIQPNVVYSDKAQKQIKFLLLKNALSPKSYNQALDVLKEADWQPCARAANGQKHGKKLTLGWLPPLPGKTAGNDYDNIRTAPTLDQPNLLHGLRSLVKEMDAKLKEYLPPYYLNAISTILNAEQREDKQDDLSRVRPLPEHLRGLLPDPLNIVKNLDAWNGFTYGLWNTVFSTLELNRNILFMAHEDKRNVKGALICIAALGDEFIGGRLVFPRYGYGAELQPHDLLICDNNRELHGNLGPLVGERFSVVAYFHLSLIEYARRESHWRPLAVKN